MKVFDHDGVSLHWREDGDPTGPPVLLLNSLGTDLRLWDGFVPHLSKHRVIRMDTRGHGLSDAPDGPYSLEVLAGDASALVDHIGLSAFSVIGVSLGGMMAQVLAAGMPDRIQRVILSNTAERMGTSEMWEDRIAAVQNGGLASIADAVLDRWFAPGFGAGADIALWRNMLKRTPTKGYMGCCKALAEADLGALSPRIAGPTLVVGGSADGASPPDIVRALARAIPGAAYQEIDSVGHLPMAEAPDRFARVVHDFLKEPKHV